MSAPSFAHLCACCMVGLCGLGMLPTVSQAQQSRGVDSRSKSLGDSPIAQTRSALFEDSALETRPGTIRRVALVVGNAKYQRLVKLNNAATDAEDMCAALGRLGFDVACHYNISNRSDFRQVVRAFTSQLNSETVALFYYAGHGVQINGENFLLPVSVDAKISLDLEEDSLNLSYLLRSLETARSSPNIVILDACRENPFQHSPGSGKGLAGG